MNKYKLNTTTPIIPEFHNRNLPTISQPSNIGTLPQYFSADHSSTSSQSASEISLLTPPQIPLTDTPPSVPKRSSSSYTTPSASSSQSHNESPTSSPTKISVTKYPQAPARRESRACSMSSTPPKQYSPVDTPVSTKLFHDTPSVTIPIKQTPINSIESTSRELLPINMKQSNPTQQRKPELQHHNISSSDLQCQISASEVISRVNKFNYKNHSLEDIENLISQFKFKQFEINPSVVEPLITTIITGCLDNIDTLCRNPQNYNFNKPIHFLESLAAHISNNQINVLLNQLIKKYNALLINPIFQYKRELVSVVEIDLVKLIEKFDSEKKLNDTVAILHTLISTCTITYNYLFYSPQAAGILLKIYNDKSKPSTAKSKKSNIDRSSLIWISKKNNKPNINNSSLFQIDRQQLSSVSYLETVIKRDFNYTVSTQTNTDLIFDIINGLKKISTADSKAFLALSSSLLERHLSQVIPTNPDKLLTSIIILAQLVDNINISHDEITYLAQIVIKKSLEVLTNNCSLEHTINIVNMLTDFLYNNKARISEEILISTLNKIVKNVCLLDVKGKFKYPFGASKILITFQMELQCFKPNEN